MKLRNIGFSIVILFSVFQPGLSQDKGPIDVDVRQVSERTMVLRVAGGDNNIVALNTKKGIVVIDTGVSPTAATTVRRKIEETFKRKDFAFVINTHFHGDHTGGNQTFADATIVGHENCPDQMKKDEERRKASIPQYKAAAERMRKSLENVDKDSEQARTLSARMAYYSLMVEDFEKNFVATPPELVFNDRLGLNLGDLSLQLFFFGPAHSNNDILIYCPEEKLWLTGDLFAPGVNPYIDSERVPFLSGWMENLQMMLDTETQTREIIPGHGEPLAFGDLKSKVEYVKEKEQEFAGKESAFHAFKKVIGDKSIDEACEKLRAMHSRPDGYYILHPEIDQFAYRLMLDGKLDDALKIMKVLSELFPDSGMAFDSLGEAYLRKGDKDLALANFQKSLELDPKNRNAEEKLKSLRSKK